MQKTKHGPVIYYSTEAKLADRARISKALAQYRSITMTAEAFGVARNTLLKRMDALGLRNGNGKAEKR